MHACILGMLHDVRELGWASFQTNTSSCIFFTKKVPICGNCISFVLYIGTLFRSNIWLHKLVILQSLEDEEWISQIIDLEEDPLETQPCW